MNSWTLLAPAGLFALTALVVPLLIHLLSRSRGQRVLVGNIELFRHIRQQRASQIRLVQWLLLALRLLMLIVAALLLAGLARQGLAPPADDIAYVTPARMAAAERHEAPLDKEHEQLVSLQGGWAQLAEALAVQRHQGTVSVYALASAIDQPARPLILASPVRWQIEGLAAARAPLSLNLVIAYDPDEPGKDRLADAQALDAAMRLVAEYRSLMIDVRIATVSDALPDGGLAENSILVWLSDKPVPADNGAAVLVTESDDDLSLLRGFISLPEWPGLSFLGSGSSADQNLRSEALWRGPQGNPLLVQSFAGGQRQIQFNQRLGLNANNPAAQDGWPDTLARLLLGTTDWNSGTAHARLPEPQPSLATALLTRGQPARSTVPLLALILGMLFLIERWLAERPRRDVNGNE